MSQPKQEIEAIGQVLTTLSALDNDGIGRVLDYACDWFRSKCYTELMEKWHAVAEIVPAPDAGAASAATGETGASASGGPQTADAPRDPAGTA